MWVQRFVLQTRRLLGRKVRLADSQICCDQNLTSSGASISSSTLAHWQTFGLSSSTSSRAQILLSLFSASSSKLLICSNAELICSISFRIFRSCFWTFFSRATSSAFLQVTFPPRDVRSSSTLFRTFMHSWPSVCTLASSLSHYKGCPVSLNRLTRIPQLIPCSQVPRS